RLAHGLRGLSCPLDHASVVLVSAMGEVEAEDIDAELGQGVDLVGRGRCRADGADDFRAQRHFSRALSQDSTPEARSGRAGARGDTLSRGAAPRLDLLPLWLTLSPPMRPRNHVVASRRG